MEFDSLSVDADDSIVEEPNVVGTASALASAATTVIHLIGNSVSRARWEDLPGLFVRSLKIIQKFYLENHFQGWHSGVIPPAPLPTAPSPGGELRTPKFLL